MDVPFYRQRLDFTCGPACLLMAMGKHDPACAPTPQLEIDVWREATYGVVPATSRYGLALAAHRRGHDVRIVSNREGIPFRARIAPRLPTYYDAIDTLDRLWTDARERARAAGLPEEIRDVTLEDVDRALDAGDVPILLTSTVHFDDPEDIPHWVVVARRGPEGYLVLNPLDDAPPRVHLDRDTMRRVMGFDGDEELVVVGPKRA